MPRRGINLTEDQWAIVKAHAASRRQTISQFFADVLADLGMDGHVRPATKAEANDERWREGLHDLTVGGTVDPGYIVEKSHMEGDVRVLEDVTLLEVSLVKDPPPGQELRRVGPSLVDSSIEVTAGPEQRTTGRFPKAENFGAPRPAPKPGRKG